MIHLFALLAIGGLMQAARSFAPGVTAVAGGTELAFGFLLLAAYFTGKIFNRIGLPKLTGYIVAGIITGPAVLELVSKPMTVQLKLVGSVATSILALEAGAELNLKAMRSQLGTVARVTIFAVFGTMIVLCGALVLMRPIVPFLGRLPFEHAVAVAACMGIAFAAQSPAVVMALIAETRADGALTRMILALVVVADLAIIVSYGVASSAATSIINGNVDIWEAAGGIGWEVFGSIGVGIFFGVVLGMFLIYINQGVGLFTVMVCLVVAEVGGALHLDPLIILLTAGLWLENVSRADARQLVHQFAQASLPFYLVFFALAGAKLDLNALYNLALPVAIIVMTRATSFFVMNKVAMAGPNVEPIIKKTAWLGLLPQAGLALALAELVRRTFPEFGDEAFALVVGVVATNELVAPVILRIALLRSGEAGRRPDSGDAASH
jgi:Kef-type K+ transport system membrane component KefB